MTCMWPRCRLLGHFNLLKHKIIRDDRIGILEASLLPRKGWSALSNIKEAWLRANQTTQGVLLLIKTACFYHS
jgi:hypothetical protein